MKVGSSGKKKLLLVSGFLLAPSKTEALIP